MTTTTMEGNRIIAEFMQHKSNVNPKATPYIYRVNGHDWKAEGLKYHTSWDWLMPVVEKIETMNFGVKQCRKVVEIYFDDSKEVIIKCKESSRIESLYTAVVQFIEWYKSQVLIA